jgi:hypothetical protein
MAHAQKPDFVFRRNGRVHLNWRGRQFSRLLTAEVCASVVVMLDTPCSDVVWRVLVTHSISQFPLHFPFRASPCAITFQLDYTIGEYAKSDHPEPGNTFSTATGVEAKIRTRHLPITGLALSRIYGTSAQTFNNTDNVRIIHHQGAFMQPLLQWKISKYYIVRVYVSSLWYPACNAHVPLLYCHLWPYRLYNNFPHYLIKGSIFGGKKLPSIKCVFFSTTTVFLYKYCSKVSHSKKNPARYHKCILVFTWSTRFYFRCRTVG